jgi:hypothetical protein
MNEQRKQVLSLVAILMAAAGLLAGGVLLQRRTELRREAAYSKIDVSLQPQPVEICQGQTEKVLVKVDPGPENAVETAEIHAAELAFDFDSSVAVVSGVSFHDKYGASVWNGKEKANSSDQVKLTALTMEQTVPTDVFDLVEISFKGTELGQFDLTMNSDYEVLAVRGETGVDLDRNLEINNPDQVITQIRVVDCDDEGGTPTEEPEASPTEGEQESDWPELTFKVKFGGTEYTVNDEQIIVSDIPDQKVDVVIKGKGQKKIYENVNVNFNEQAVGTGSVELEGVTPGSGYSILIKGPVHLARRYCQNNQQEHCWLGEGNLTISSGQNSFDWTGLELEPGDINRDGVVDVTDFTDLKAAIGKSGTDIPEDLNRNGTVTGQDIVFFLDTLSRRYEEEI